MSGETDNLPDWFKGPWRYGEAERGLNPRNPYAVAYVENGQGDRVSFDDISRDALFYRVEGRDGVAVFIVERGRERGLSAAPLLSYGPYEFHPRDPQLDRKTLVSRLLCLCAYVLACWGRGFPGEDGKALEPRRPVQVHGIGALDVLFDRLEAQIGIRRG